MVKLTPVIVLYKFYWKTYYVEFPSGGVGTFLLFCAGGETAFVVQMLQFILKYCNKILPGVFNYFNQVVFRRDI